MLETSTNTLTYLDLKRLAIRAGGVVVDVLGDNQDISSETLSRLHKAISAAVEETVLSILPLSEAAEGDGPTLDEIRLGVEQ